jgi:hypothetical protein
MNESTAGGHSAANVKTSLEAGAELNGVRGWLLALCLMLTVLGPIISVWLMAYAYIEAAPLASKSFGVQVSVLASLLLSACAVAFGAHAGLQLWLIRPNAVNTAKHALLFGLAIDVFTTAIEAVTASVPGVRLLFLIEVSLIPSAIFFTLCFAYLNRSRRVFATYRA